MWPWSSQASPSRIVIKEGEPTLDSGLEAQKSYPGKLGTLQSLGFMEEAGAREAFWGRGLSTRLLLTMGMWSHFSF